MLDQLTQLVEREKIWVDENHRFRLTPDVFKVTSDQLDQLQILGKAIHDCLAGIGRIAVVAGDERLARVPALKRFNKTLWAGIPSNFKTFTALHPGAVPQTLKVDLLMTPEGTFKVGEIDAYNERSLGYCELCAMMRTVIAPCGNSLPGIANRLSEVIVKTSGKTELLLIYAEKERFYLPEFEILGRALARHGINLTIGCELDFQVERSNLLLNGVQVDPRLVVYYPFIHRNSSLEAWLKAATLDGTVKFLIPPTPFLGSKSVLAMLRNDIRDAQIEAILTTFIPEEALKTIRSFLPPTFMVREGDPLPSEGRFILKRAVSSGAKGIFFPGDSDYGAALATARKGNSTYILQEEVETARIDVRYFEGTCIKTEPSFLRVNAYYIGRELADMAVTATQEKLVHGGTKSSFMGVVVD